MGEVAEGEEAKGEEMKTDEPITETNTCTICGHNRMSGGGQVVLRGGVKICMDCLHEKVDPKRAKRNPDRLREDYLVKKSKEITTLREELAAVRQEIVQARTQRDAVMADIDRLRRLPFLNRMAFLFNPFSSEAKR